MMAAPLRKVVLELLGSFLHRSDSVLIFKEKDRSVSCVKGAFDFLHEVSTCFPTRSLDVSNGRLPNLPVKVAKRNYNTR